MYVPASTIGLAASVSAGATANSSVIPTNGQTRGTVGLQSSHAGTLNVQRYVDANGVIPLGTVITVAVVAATPNSVSWADGDPSGSLIVSFVNSAGAVANLTNVTVLLAP